MRDYTDQTNNCIPVYFTIYQEHGIFSDHYISSHSQTEWGNILDQIKCRILGVLRSGCDNVFSVMVDIRFK